VQKKYEGEGESKVGTTSNFPILERRANTNLTILQDIYLALCKRIYIIFSSDDLHSTIQCGNSNCMSLREEKNV